MTSPFKAGYVAIVGRPNVGKSTLMNQLIHEKLAIVSPKPQTTRHRILGILTGKNYQAIFLDTPGLIKPNYLLQEAMMETVSKTMKDADLILMMLDASDIRAEDELVLQAVSQSQRPKCLLINKADKVPKLNILPIIDRFRNDAQFKEIIPISALKNDGLEVLLEQILKYLPEGVPFYPPDMVSDEPERFFVAELIREQIFMHFGDEIPYATAVQIEQFEERPGRKDFIRAVISVERSSQKGILIGKQGQALKKIGSAARVQIEQFLERPVYLQLDVRVQKKWRKDPAQVKRFGYQSK